MKYVLDSDTLIRSKNDFYRFDTAPGFWEFLEQENILDIVGSVDAVRKELVDEKNQLAEWVKTQGTRFFVSPDDTVTTSLGTIAKWINENRQFSDAAKTEFLSAADFVLIGYAHAKGCKVVTFEKDEPGAIHRIKIPTVCKAFGVDCMPLFQMLSELKFRLVLDTTNSN
jgi:hypothetical protein